MSNLLTCFTSPGLLKGNKFVKTYLSWLNMGCVCWKILEGAAGTNSRFEELANHCSNNDKHLRGQCFSANSEAVESIWANTSSHFTQQRQC